MATLVMQFTQKQKVFALAVVITLPLLAYFLWQGLVFQERCAYVDGDQVREARGEACRSIP